VTGSRDKTAKVWDSDTLNLMGTLKGHRKGVWDAKFSSWDQLIATSSADTTIKIWSLATFECIQVRIFFKILDIVRYFTKYEQSCAKSEK